MIILVCGLSRSGKTSAIREIIGTCVGLLHVRASAVLRENGGKINDLRISDIVSNQSILSQKINDEFSKLSSAVVLDGHLLLETLDGPQLIPDTCLQTLKLSAIFYLFEDAYTLAKRREGTKLTNSVEEIVELEGIEWLQAKRFARLNKIPIFRFRSSDKAGIADGIADIFSSSRLA